MISLKTIVLNGDYGFLDKIETTIKSIIYHNQKVKIYVINPDIPHEWFINLNQYLNQIGSQIVDKKLIPDFYRNYIPGICILIRVLMVDYLFQS